jgi:hypothetical protein
MRKEHKPWGVRALRYLHQACGRHAPVETIASKLKRSEGSIRQKARHEGLSVGVNQRRVATAKRRPHRARRLGL